MDNSLEPIWSLPLGGAGQDVAQVLKLGADNTIFVAGNVQTSALDGAIQVPAGACSNAAACADVFAVRLQLSGAPD